MRPPADDGDNLGPGPVPAAEYPPEISELEPKDDTIPGRNARRHPEPSTLQGDQMIAIYIDAGHSTSGNPKRGWIITDDEGSFVDFVDEGYSGRGALKEAGYDCATTPRLEVAGHVYKELKKDAERRHISTIPPRTKKSSHR